MGKNLSISSLVLEITNACNMQCAHCLRGEGGKDFMDTRIIDAVIEEVDSFSITFSGGEPSLNPAAIKYATDKIIKNNKNVWSFFVATNGKIYSQTMVNSLIELYGYTTHNNGGDEEDNYSGLALSKDEFHEEIDEMNEYRYRGLSFFDESKMKNFDWKGIIDEGSASSNGLGTRSLERESLSLADDAFSKEYLYVDSIIYINVFGDVIIGCDYSYESQQEYKIGNVLERPLFDILYDAAIEAGHIPDDCEELKVTA